jgi:hypothetical protein
MRPPTSSGTSAARDPAPESLGTAALRELGMMSARRIRAYLAAFTAVEGSGGAFPRDGIASLRHRADRLALIGFLRAWGCRHLRRDDTERTQRALAAWWRRWGARLPDSSTAVTELGLEQFEHVVRAYDALSTAPAAGRRAPGGEVEVTFGHTATAKAFFALRPEAFPPWDEPIRVAFGPRTSGVDYSAYLRHTAAALHSLSARFGLDVDALPPLLGRPGSTAAKMVDEYLWIRITRGA